MLMVQVNNLTNLPHFIENAKFGANYRKLSQNSGWWRGVAGDGKKVKWHKKMRANSIHYKKNLKLDIAYQDQK